MTYAGLYLLTIVLAGFYPSLILSAFEPIKAVTGKLSMSGSGLTVRQCITVFQFVISVILILFSIAIKEQMKFMTRFNTGIRKENVIMIPFNNSIGNHYAALKKEVGRMASVQGVTTARYELYEGNYDALLVNVDGKPGSFALPIMNVDADFIEVMGLKWILPPHDSVYQKKKNIVAVNPAAISKLHLPDDPRNYRMPLSFSDVYITGVLSNFHFSSLHYPVDPMCIFINQDTTNIWSEFGTMYVRFNDREGIHAGVPQIKKIYEQFVSNAPFEYAFLDDAYLSRYKAERKLAAISSVFTVVTVLISCLGLFGLITFNTHKRTKEMGVRKVLGASVEDIAVLLSRDLIKLVMIAMLISCPVAWYVMDRWLQNYAYRVQISVWFFAVTIVAVMLLAVLSTCVQAVRAAVANPVKSLRTE
jgi:putative ABC transport system permease protein